MLNSIYIIHREKPYLPVHMKNYLYTGYFSGKNFTLFYTKLSISTSYYRVNCLKPIPFTAAHPI